MESHLEAAGTSGVPMESHRQLGVILRATRQLLVCENYREVIAVLDMVAANLNLSGLYQLTGIHFKETRKIGLGIPRELCPSLFQLMARSDKIAIANGLMVFRGPNLLVVLNAGELSPRESDPVQDNLAMFLDSVQQWLDRHRLLLQTETVICDRLDEFRSSLASGARHMKRNRVDLTDRLLADFVSTLPILGLEADQEDCILDTLQPVIDSMQKNLCNQSEVNEDFVRVIDEMLAFVRRHGALERAYPVVESNDMDSVLLF